MKKKILVSLFFILCLIFALCACGDIRVKAEPYGKQKEAIYITI